MRKLRQIEGDICLIGRDIKCRADYAGKSLYGLKKTY